MNDFDKLDQLRPIANEMLGGLHADEAMRHRIRRAAMEGAVPGKHTIRRNTMKRAVPAVCLAALALACVGVAGVRLNRPAEDAVLLKAAKAPDAAVVEIATIAAGDSPTVASELMADIGGSARIGAQAAQEESLFASADGDIAMIAVEGRVYRMLKTPKDIAAGMLSGEVGSVALHDTMPSMASPKEMQAGLSNVAAEGAAVYGVNGLDASTAVAAEVDGSMRVFQRVSYAGRGPSGASLEETFSVRGKVKEMTLSGVGTLEGGKANDVIAVLLDEAVLKSADATARSQTLTVTLDSGLKLQLGVSGDTLCGCGGWSCPEFFEAFEAAL